MPPTHTHAHTCTPICTHTCTAYLHVTHTTHTHTHTHTHAQSHMNTNAHTHIHVHKICRLLPLDTPPNGGRVEGLICSLRFPKVPTNGIYLPEVQLYTMYTSTVQHTHWTRAHLYTCTSRSVISPDVRPTSDANSLATTNFPLFSRRANTCSDSTLTLTA